MYFCNVTLYRCWVGFRYCLVRGFRGFCYFREEILVFSNGLVGFGLLARVMIEISFLCLCPLKEWKGLRGCRYPVCSCWGLAILGKMRCGAWWGPGYFWWCLLIRNRIIQWVCLYRGDRMRWDWNEIDLNIKSRFFPNWFYSWSRTSSETVTSYAY